MRPLMAMAFLAAAAGTAAAEGNDAEKLFRAMQDKVRAAKTLHVRFDLQVTDALGKKWAVKGSLVLGEGDKYRAEAEGKLFGEPVKFTEVSDGTNASYRDAHDPKRASTEKTISGAGAYFRAALPREGFLLGSLNMKQRAGWPPASYRLSDFKFAGKEKIAGRDTQAVQFKLTIKGASEPLPMTVWIDAENRVPVRLAATGGKSDIRDVTETYDEFKVNSKVDATAFQLPK